MFAVGKVCAVLSILLFKQVFGLEGKIFVNLKTKLCPNGVIYREGCKMCFCVEEVSGLVTVKCESLYIDAECAAVSLRAHCEPDRLLYDYKRECEGECTCNEAKNLTTCENLPCDNTFLWFLGYYDEADLSVRTKYVRGSVRTDDSSDKVVKKSVSERSKRNVPERTKLNVLERTKRSVRGTVKRSILSETDDTASAGTGESILHERKLWQQRRRNSRTKAGSKKHKRKSRTNRNKSTKENTGGPMKMKMGKWLSGQMSTGIASDSLPESSTWEHINPDSVIVQPLSTMNQDADPESDVESYKNEASSNKEHNYPESNIEDDEDDDESTTDDDDDVDADNNSDEDIDGEPYFEEDDDAHDLTITKYISSQKKKNKKKTACSRNAARSEKVRENKPPAVEECHHEKDKGDTQESCDSRSEEETKE